MKVFDACVVGAGGVVGSAVLRDLAERGLSVIGIEKHDGPAQETSGTNSGVVHSGFHEKAGTLKARLALAGSRMLIDYAAKKGVRLLRTGMLIAIPRRALRNGLWRESAALWHLWRGGRAHHIHFEWILSRSAVREIVPVEAVAGIFIPSVCVVDVVPLIASLQRDAQAAGADIRYGQAVTEIADRSEHHAITTSTGHFAARAIINSAGLSAPWISRIAGGPEYNIERIRGEYYELKGGIERWRIRTLVYPATPSKSRSKGIHFGPRPDGRLYIGPDATDPDSAPSPKDLFVRAAQNFLPAVRASDLEYARAGIRPKYTGPDGISDFVVRLDRSNPPLINLIGIDSPGLSACLAIAQYAGDLLTSSEDSRKNAWG
jgi:glycerol-3-phosphate dehydrogenase